MQLYLPSNMCKLTFSLIISVFKFCISTVCLTIVMTKYKIIVTVNFLVTIRVVVDKIGK